MINTFFRVFVLAVFVLTASLSSAITRENVKVHMLTNGLKVLLLESKTIPNISYYTFFRVGGRNEVVGLTGVSHFIEHMMFNGSPKFGPGEFDRVMEFHGGANNAYTGMDMTAYTDWFPSSALEKMMEMEADRIQDATFDPNVFESERGVVASERRLSVENNNDHLLDETVQATAILAHPYHHGVIGWMSDILNWKRDAVLKYYKTYYAPNNAVLIVVGDFETKKIIPMIERYYGKIPAATPPPKVTTMEPQQLGPRKLVIRREAQTPGFQAVYPVSAATHPDFPALQLLDLILLRGESSRLYRKLVRDCQLAVSVYGGIQETIDPFLFSFVVKPKVGIELDRIETEIETVLADIVKNGVTPNELQKAKNQVRTDFYSPLETIAGQANLLGQMEIIYGDWQATFQVIPKIEAVTAERVREVAATYLVPDKKTIGLLIPKEGEK